MACYKHEQKHPLSTSEGDRYSKNSVEEYLIFMTKTIIELLNARVYEHPFFRTHLSPNMYNNFNGIIESGFDTCVGNYKNVADKSPAFWTGIVNETALMDERKGIVTVLLSQDMYDHTTAGGKMCGVVAYTWQWSDNGWICKGVSMMYGTPEFLAV